MSAYNPNGSTARARAQVYNRHDLRNGMNTMNTHRDGTTRNGTPPAPRTNGSAAIGGAK